MKIVLTGSAVAVLLLLSAPASAQNATENARAIESAGPPVSAAAAPRGSTQNGMLADDNTARTHRRGGDASTTPNTYAAKSSPTPTDSGAGTSHNSR